MRTLGLLVLVVLIVVILVTNILGRKKRPTPGEPINIRSIMLANVETLVIKKLNLRDDDFTEMVNVYLRDRYQKERMDTWLEMTEEEATKVLRQYGGMRGV
jgi:dephospho-CoA kinase